MKTGELSRVFEIDRTSLNYYVRIGLLNPQMLDNQYHRYSFPDFVALSYIRHYRGLGFSTEQIKKLTQEEDNQGKLNYFEQARQALKDEIRLLQLKQCFLENAENMVKFLEEYRDRQLLTQSEAYYFIRREDIQDPVLKELYKLLPCDEFDVHVDENGHVEFGNIRSVPGISLKESWVKQFAIELPARAVYYPAKKKCLFAFRISGQQLDEELEMKTGMVYQTMESQGIRLKKDFIAYLTISHYNDEGECFDLFGSVEPDLLD